LGILWKRVTLVFNYLILSRNKRFISWIDEKWRILGLRFKMDIIAMKVIALVVLLLIGGTFAMIPFLAVKTILKNEVEADRILSLGSTLAGGIFLGGGFIHLLPEAVALFAKTGINFGVPMAELLAVGGFLAVFLVEKVIFLRDESWNQGRAEPIDLGPETKVQIERTSSEVNLTNGSGMVELEDVDMEIKEEPEEREEGSHHESKEDGHKKGHDHSHFVMDPNSSSPLPYLLMIVLSIHSVIAGFALGVQNNIDYVYAIFFAILSHKWVESFALGVSLVKNKVARQTLIKCILLYSFMVPSGIVVGLILSFVVTGQASDVIQAFVGGIASGTFIYIALVDVLLVEFSVARDKWWKYLLTVFGFTVITLSVLLFDADAE